MQPRICPSIETLRLSDALGGRFQLLPRKAPRSRRRAALCRCECVGHYFGQGARARRQGSYLAILQKPPIKARATWKDHKIPDRWTERIIRPKSQHPHLKPIGLIARLIGAVTVPGDLVVDPAAGSFVVMRVANEMGRRFVGCDIACQPAQSAFAPFEDIPTAEAAE